MAGEEAGVRGAAMRVGASALALLRTRIELASVEFALERERVKTSLVLIVAAAVAFALAVIVATLGVIAWFWDDHRYAAIVIVVLVYAIAGVAALIAQRRVRPQGAVPFSATTEALRRDVEWLRARHSHAHAEGGGDSGSRRDATGDRNSGSARDAGEAR